jgi:hypothetical protein
MDQVIEDTARGWEHIAQNIVELGFLLVDSGRVIMVWLHVNEQGKYYPDIKDCPYAMTQAIGRNILIKVYETHDFVRAEVINQCLNKVEALHVCGLKYLDLVSYFVSSDVIAHSTRVRLIY